MTNSEAFLWVGGWEGAGTADRGVLGRILLTYMLMLRLSNSHINLTSAFGAGVWLWLAVVALSLLPLLLPSAGITGVHHYA